MRSKSLGIGLLWLLSACAPNRDCEIPLGGTFSDTLTESSPSQKAYEYLFKSNEATIPLHLRGTGRIHIDEISIDEISPL